MFLLNAIPHLTHGLSGDEFPSPFSDPPGKGASAPVVNTLWAFINIIIGYLLFRGGKVRHENKAAIVVFFIGALAMGIMLSFTFMEKLTD